MDKLTYGVGKIIAGMEHCRVLCVYIRAENQTTHSNYPARGSKFHFDTKTLRLESPGEGREAYAEITHAIAGTLKKMENDYFAGRSGAQA